MELNHLSQSLYPRAVKPSVEGRLRDDGQDRDITPNPAAASNKRAADAVQRQRNQQSRHDEIDRRAHNEQSYTRRSAEQEHELAGYSEAATVGDRFAVASRQARQSHAKRSYLTPALVSSRGREANRRYLDASMSNQARFIDELV